MELGNQIKKYRNELSLSQDALADKIFVSRQTISNWENDKSYPDVNSLVLLSEVFQVSIDNLIKGDLEEMKEIVKEEDKKEFEKVGNIHTIMMIVVAISAVPLISFLGIAGWVIWGILVCVNFYYAFRVEKLKKKFDIQTYREIVAFTEGKNLTELEKAREEGRRPYENILKLIFGGVFGFVIAALMMWIINLIF